MTKISTKLTGRTLVDRIAYQVVRSVLEAFNRIWCRMTIEGKENVPAEGLFLLAPTHRSILDTPIASGVTRRRMRFMGADKYWKNKAFGRLLTSLGGFPVTRGTADREALKRCIAVLEGGEPLVLFPEGERKTGPIVQPLFDGATLTTPYAANDDGGFFRWKAWQYYQTGAMSLSSAPSAPTNLRIVP